MLKKSTLLIFLFTLILQFFPFLAAAEQIEEDILGYFGTRLRETDRAYITDPNMERWLGHLNTCYTRLNDLTDYIPYANYPDDGRIWIESVDYDFNGWAAMGNPIIWYQPYIAEALTDINDNDDWSFGMIHEISHIFDHESWLFHAEVLGTFKTLYIFDKEPKPCNYAETEAANQRQIISTDFTNTNQAFLNHGIITPSIIYWLDYIQSYISWTPFEQAFAYIKEMLNPPQTSVDKFMIFLMVLDSFTDQDAIAMIPTEQLNQIKHYLAKGELSNWQDNQFERDIRLKAIRETTPGQVKLYWSDYLNTEDGYEIEYSVNDGAFVYLAQTGANAHQYIINNLSDSNTYKFRIRAFSNSSYISYTGYSYYSREVVPDKLSAFQPASADGGIPERAFDDDINTEWLWLGAEPHYLTVDLEGIQVVDKFIVKHAGADGTPSRYNTRDFKIQKSVDGQTWDDVVVVAGNTDSITTHILAQPVYAAYFRLYITKATLDADTVARIAEFEVYHSSNPDALTNAALNKTATADNYLPDQGPGKAVDGTIGNTAWCVTSVQNHHLQVDLGMRTDISYLVIKHAGIREKTDYNTKAYTLKLSMTDTNWDGVQPVVTVTNNTANVTSYSISPPAAARYVRLDITEATQTAETTARIYELEAWGELTAGNFEVLYKNADTSATNNQIKPHFKIVNQSGANVNLSEFKLRYWYTRDTSADQSFVCDYAAVGTANVSGAFTAVNPTRTGADYYLEVSFNQSAGQLATGSNSGEIQTRFNKTDWSDYNETGDYSFDAAKTDYASWNNVTLYWNNQLVWGVEP